MLIEVEDDSKTLEEIGDNAGELLAAFRAHRVANCDFANTILAVFGVSSPAGHIIDRTINGISGVITRFDWDFRDLGEDCGWHYAKAPPDKDVEDIT
jgi:hypothetical protein